MRPAAHLTPQRRDRLRCKLQKLGATRIINDLAYLGFAKCNTAHRGWSTIRLTATSFQELSLPCHPQVTAGFEFPLGLG